MIVEATREGMKILSWDEGDSELPTNIAIFHDGSCININQDGNSIRLWGVKKEIKLLCKVLLGFCE